MTARGDSPELAPELAEDLQAAVPAAVRARLAEKLSVENLARLDELERQRVGYAVLEAVPAADRRTDPSQTELPSAALPIVKLRSEKAARRRGVGGKGAVA